MGSPECDARPRLSVWYALQVLALAFLGWLVERLWPTLSMVFEIAVVTAIVFTMGRVTSRAIANLIRGMRRPRSGSIPPSSDRVS